MLGRRAIGAIIGIISACSLILLLIACCIVYYRRYLKRKGHSYAVTSQVDDQQINQRTSIQQPQIVNRTINTIPSDSPPPYSEAIKGLPDI
ncbi:unnamed protein product [Rotaria sordida]|uniref:Uncharacterized protein n=1 Tax=Rotaria sordida TaxID=392033 RepID=A0A813SCW9_9BILA|nr:unnamed protein product [Rotaria sordida]CAF0794375.1 unnamed protein product [Rotaria sordida]CAF0858169.1 unnamed protein product [Rotaria sordida]CAF0896840.1 unnamed protein product [Rotaria sordida]CAF0904415.1 unnamed protein product [Rotaria sordida]